MNQLYETVALLALKSNQSEEVERAVNLWMVLVSQVNRGALTKKDAKIDGRKSAIASRLDELAAEDTRPNNALLAETIRAVLDLQGAIARRDPDAIDAVWRTFQKIVEKSESLGDYPFERLPSLVYEFAELGVESAELDKLFELVVTSLEKRKGDAAGAELLNDRGFKKLEAGRPYEGELSG